MTRWSDTYRAVLLQVAICAPLMAQPWSFSPGEHICYIGNTLADRMQHAGWLETYLQALHPEHQLVFRNLAFPGDQVDLRARSENFGDPHQWLTKCQADTVFCFFGYNEALQGELAEFRVQLAEMINDMRQQRYNGRSAPRLILFGPIAHEDLRSPHLPDGARNNRSLATYTDAMREVCHDHDVRFIDLFAVTEQLYTEATEPLTINGVHLTDEGNRRVARAIVDQLFPDRALPADDDLATLREAVLEKNYHWFSRYRVVDGYNVYGGRSKLAWHGQSNADVLRREMEIFDILTANRDRRIGAVARGEPFELKDENLPPLLTVRTNKEGPLPGGRFAYLSGEEAIGQMRVHEGLRVNLFASEEQFPRLANPAQMAVDTDSRLWVSVWPSYPHWTPTQPRRDALLILPDDDQDGRADRCIVFADELNSVTGFEFWGGGVIVAAPPELWFLKDTDGDDRADVKQRILQGVSSADTHHSANAMLIGPDGWLYWSRGIFNVGAFETPTKTFRSDKSGVYRFNPRTFEIEFHFPIGPNPHGHVFDQWGYEFANDGTGGTGSYVNIGRGIGNHTFYQQRVRPVAAAGLLASSHFPTAMQGNYLLCNVIGVRGVLQFEFEVDGADIRAREVTPIVESDDENFRPSDLEIGGDGALYIADWHNSLIGHMQHNIRDPNRDHEHGRIYRVTATGRPLLQPARFKDRPIAEVCQGFLAKENGTRYRARLELSGRDTDEVVRGLDAFLSGLNVSDGADGEGGSKNGRPDQGELAAGDRVQAMLECLWTFEEHRVPRIELIEVLQSAEEPRVRAAAIRTLGHWSGRVEGWQPLLAMAASDPSPLVRAEAIKSAAEFQLPAAAEVLFDVAAMPLDTELNRLLGYASQRLKLDDWIDQTLQAQRPLSDNGRRYVVDQGGPDLLVKLPPTRETLQAIIVHPDSDADQVREAVRRWAKDDDATASAVVLQLLQQIDPHDAPRMERLGQLLARQPAEELKSLRETIQELAWGPNPALRSACQAAWIIATGPEAAFAFVRDDAERLSSFLAAIPTLELDGRSALFEPLATWVGDATASATPLARDPALLGKALVAVRSIPERETEQLALFAHLLSADRGLEQVVNAMQGMSLELASPRQRAMIGESIVGFLTEQSPESRTSDTGSIAFKVLDQLIAAGSDDEVRQLSEHVDALRVDIVPLGVVPHRMMFDTDRIVLQAGRWVQLHFENTDAMPHNVVMTLPGALEEIGQLAESTGQGSAALQRDYVPESVKIIVASRLLQPTESQRITFKTPSAPGIYPLVCTYPGHWRRMFAAAVVVEDIKAYKADPESYLASKGLLPQDALLSGLRAAHPWTFDELVGDLAELDHGRSVEEGRRLFRTSTCTGCHLLQDEGQLFGADLRTLTDESRRPQQLLKSLIEPSAKIDDPFASYIFHLESGRILTGLIVAEEPDRLKVAVGPTLETADGLCGDSAVYIHKADIEQQVRSPESLMPAGLLDRLTREEILDLIAYVYAKGDPTSPIFQPPVVGNSDP